MRVHVCAYLLYTRALGWFRKVGSITFEPRFSANRLPPILSNEKIWQYVKFWYRRWTACQLLTTVTLIEIAGSRFLQTLSKNLVQQYKSLNLNGDYAENSDYECTFLMYKWNEVFPYYCCFISNNLLLCGKLSHKYHFEIKRILVNFS